MVNVSIISRGQNICDVEDTLLSPACSVIKGYKLQSPPHHALIFEIVQSFTSLKWKVYNHHHCCDHQLTMEAVILIWGWRRLENFGEHISSFVKFGALLLTLVNIFQVWCTFIKFGAHYQNWCAYRFFLLVPPTKVKSTKKSALQSYTSILLPCRNLIKLEQTTISWLKSAANF